VRFELASVEIGGTEIAFDATVAPIRDENSVSFARGALVERYELAPETMEHLFVVESLPARGELRLRRRSAHRLFRVPRRPIALDFSNELGVVRYTRAVAVDANGARLPLETKLAGQAIEIVVPASFVDLAALPLTIDPVISVFSVETPLSRTKSAPTSRSTRAPRATSSCLSACTASSTTTSTRSASR
jgi:hypothetical protein